LLAAVVALAGCGREQTEPALPVPPAPPSPAPQAPEPDVQQFLPAQDKFIRLDLTLDPDRQQLGVMLTNISGEDLLVSRESLSLDFEAINATPLSELVDLPVNPGPCPQDGIAPDASISWRIGYRNGEIRWSARGGGTQLGDGTYRIRAVMQCKEDPDYADLEGRHPWSGHLASEWLTVTVQQNLVRPGAGPMLTM
jgi:hypothetical protein